ncbi:DUF806 family protein [Schleiferilactobacillus harbinensis]|uniref:DUF806 family protein n=1 Tax=Schleiferilactobacillus harbinensis TaxID=304207 RepID=A0A5P8M410_9LACO|nr:DUF806 family protein [Schleiferilactobacillus harbinensis]QFR23226.1 DUF806 family protein [Schleiferilactobacillus harbinensis]
MTAVKEMADLLTSAGIPGVDHVYDTMLPGGKHASVKTTDVLVTDVVETFDDYGSDVSTTKQRTVALNIFYGTESSANADTVEDSLVSFLSMHGWACVYSPGHTIDPDTSQLSKVMQFKNLKNRKEVE